MFTLLEKKFLRETFKTLFNVLQKMSYRKSLRRYKSDFRGYNATLRV